MYTELRSRTVCEMVLCPEFYTTGDTLAKEVVRNLAPISASFKEGHDLQDDETIMKIFQDECITATRSGTYSSMWHIYGLASAVHCVQRSVYPQAAQRIRPILNSAVHPRVISDGFYLPTPSCGPELYQCPSAMLDGLLIILLRVFPVSSFTIAINLQSKLCQPLSVHTHQYLAAATLNWTYLSLHQ